MAYDLSAEPLAVDLDELHRKYTGVQIVGLVRKRLKVVADAYDPAVFREAFRVYDAGNPQSDELALRAYHAFLGSNETRVPLEVARCLLPGSMH